MAEDEPWHMSDSSGRINTLTIHVLGRKMICAAFHRAARFFSHDLLIGEIPELIST